MYIAAVHMNTLVHIREQRHFHTHHSIYTHRANDSILTCKERDRWKKMSQERPENDTTTYLQLAKARKQDTVNGKCKYTPVTGDINCR